MCSLWYIHFPDFFSHYCWCNTLLRVENCMQCSAWNVWRPHSYIPPILSCGRLFATVSSCFFSLVMSKSGRKMKLVFLTMPLCSGERFCKVVNRGLKWIANFSCWRWSLDLRKRKINLSHLCFQGIFCTFEWTVSSSCQYSACCDHKCKGCFVPKFLPKLA